MSRDSSWWLEAEKRLDRILDWAKKARGGAYDVLVPVSGGKDSLYVLYKLCVEKNLKVLAYTYDNGLMSETAFTNLELAVMTLGVSHIMVRHSFQNDLVVHFLKKTGNICGACFIPMVFSAFELARRFQIPLIAFGVSRRFDPMLPRGKNPWHFWNVVNDGFDRERLRGVWASRPVFRWLLDSLTGRVRVICLPDYTEWDEEEIRGKLESSLGVSLGEEHSDCIGFPYADYLAFKRYGVSIRAIKLSTLVRNGKISREEALRRANGLGFRDVPEKLEALAQRLSVTVDDLLTASSIDETKYYMGVMNYLSELYRNHFLGRPLFGF